MRGKKKRGVKGKKNIKMFIEERAHQLCVCVCVYYISYKRIQTRTETMLAQWIKKNEKERKIEKVTTLPKRSVFFCNVLFLEL